MEFPDSGYLRPTIGTEHMKAEMRILFTLSSLTLKMFTIPRVHDLVWNMKLSVIRC